MRIDGLGERSQDELRQALEAGGRFVFYEFCISLVVITFRRPSRVYFLPANDLGLVRGLPYSLCSLLLGWWGLPWGVIYTPLTVLTNLTGGCDVTAQVWPLLAPAADDPMPH